MGLGQEKNFPDLFLSASIFAIVMLSNIISAYGRDINNLLGKEKTNLLYPTTIDELKRKISQGSTGPNSPLNATSTASVDKGTDDSANDQANIEQSSQNPANTTLGEQKFSWFIYHEHQKLNNSYSVIL